MQIARSTFRYVAHGHDDTELLAQIRELVARHPRYGYRRITAVLRRTAADGTPLRILTVMDEFTREGLALDVALTTSAERVIGVLSTLIAQHDAPAYLRSDNGAEFVAIAVQTWLAQCGIQTLYIEPGTPWQNGKEERFNGTVRDECLNLHQFYSVAESCVRLSTFRHHYNYERPHSRLGYLTPVAFKMAWYEAQAKEQDPHIGT